MSEVIKLQTENYVVLPALLWYEGVPNTPTPGYITVYLKEGKQFIKDTETCLYYEVRVCGHSIANYAEHGLVGDVVRLESVDDVELWVADVPVHAWEQTRRIAELLRARPVVEQHQQ